MAAAAICEFVCLCNCGLETCGTRHYLILIFSRSFISLSCHLVSSDYSYDLLISTWCCDLRVTAQHATICERKRGVNTWGNNKSSLWLNTMHKWWEWLAHRHHPPTARALLSFFIVISPLQLPLTHIYTHISNWMSERERESRLSWISQHFFLLSLVAYQLSLLLSFCDSSKKEREEGAIDKRKTASRGVNGT
jgi:hypothetical protein